MCRNIRMLFNFQPPANEKEIRDCAVQFVRKVSGYTKPSQANQEAFDRAVEETAEVVRRLLDTLTTTAPPRNREEEAARLKEASARRFGRG